MSKTPPIVKATVALAMLVFITVMLLKPPTEEVIEVPVVETAPMFAGWTIHQVTSTATRRTRGFRVLAIRPSDLYNHPCTYFVVQAGARLTVLDKICDDESSSQ